MSDGTPKKTITFMVRMPIPDDADPAGQAAELLRYGVSGVEIVPHPRIPTPPVIDSVAKAIAEADLTDIEWDNDEWPERKDVYRRLAEAATAAYEAAIVEPHVGPTDAQIEEGAIALHNFTQEPSGQDRPWENFPEEYQDLFRERARIVLIAARTTRQS
jgi:hypothetical protein